MVELADTQDLGSCADGMQVRPLLPAPRYKKDSVPGGLSLFLIKMFKVFLRRNFRRFLFRPLKRRTRNERRRACFRLRRRDREAFESRLRLRVRVRNVPASGRVIYPRGKSCSKSYLYPFERYCRRYYKYRLCICRRNLLPKRKLCFHFLRVKQRSKDNC